MGSLNKAIFTGRLTADPETRYTADEKPVTHFSVAVNRGQKDDKKAADFFNCIAWGNLAKICGEYLKKGQLVGVEGRLQNRKFTDKQGQNRSVTEIIASSVEMLSFAKKKQEVEAKA